MISRTMFGVLAADVLSDLVDLIGCGDHSVVERILIQSKLSEQIAQHSGCPEADQTICEWNIGGGIGEHGGKVTG